MSSHMQQGNRRRGTSPPLRSLSRRRREVRRFLARTSRGLSNGLDPFGVRRGSRRRIAGRSDDRRGASPEATPSSRLESLTQQLHDVVRKTIPEAISRHMSRLRGGLDGRIWWLPRPRQCGMLGEEHKFAVKTGLPDTPGGGPGKQTRSLP